MWHRYSAEKPGENRLTMFSCFPGYVQQSEQPFCESPPALRRKAASPRRAGPNGRSFSWPSAGSPAAPPGGSVPRRRSHETSHPVTVGFNLFCPGCQPVALRATGVDTQGIGSSSRAKMELLKMSDNRHVSDIFEPDDRRFTPWPRPFRQGRRCRRPLAAGCTGRRHRIPHGPDCGGGWDRHGAAVGVRHRGRPPRRR